MPEVAARGYTSGLGAHLDEPRCVLSVNVNALNYCAYDVVLLQRRHSDALHAYLAVPNTLESAWIDVYELPSGHRVVEALGRSDAVRDGAYRPPIVMALQMLLSENLLYIAAGYEDGGVQAWALQCDVDGAFLGAASLLWSHVPLSESIMALCVAPDATVLYVGADERLARLALTPGASPEVHMLPRTGNACIAVRPDYRAVAIGAWDGRVRVFSADISLLATLSYHKASVYAIAFARHGDAVHRLDVDSEDSSDDDEGLGISHRLLACGSKDGRISLWDVPWTAGELAVS